MYLQIGNDEENDLRADELMALISMITNTPSTQNFDGRFPRNLRHVPRDRIYEILKSLKMKSILYSPVGDASIRPRDVASSISIHELRSFRKLGFFDRKAIESRSFDLVVKSLEHKFSVYGHRVFSAEDEGIVPSPVYCAIVDSSGKYVVTGADDFLIKVWSVETGLLCATLLGHTAEICDMAFSPCMQFLVSLCSEDFSVVIWRKKGEGEYIYQCRLVEIDLKDFSKNLKPIFMEFCPIQDTPLRLVVAYTNGCLVVHELLATGRVSEFNRVIPFEKMELKSLALLPSKDGDSSSITVLAGVSRQYSMKSILCYGIRGRGTSPNFAEYPFGGSVAKSPISHISVANKSSSFVANDDENSSVFFYRDSTGREDFDKIALLRGCQNGDSLLVDDSSLSERLGISPRSLMRYSVDLTVFSKNDEFIFCSICGVRKQSVSIAEDDDSEIYSVLIFDSETGALCGILPSNRDHVFNIGPVERGEEEAEEVVGSWAYMFKGSYDGTLEFLKVKKTCSNDLLIHSLNTFNINKDDLGSNRPRSILDCHVRTAKDGHIVVAASDTKGSITVFSTDCQINVEAPAEQFFHNDYSPIRSEIFASRNVGIVKNDTRITSIQSGGIPCDSRLVDLSELQTPSPPVLFAVCGSEFTNRYLSTSIEVIPWVPLQNTVHATASIKGPGRPKLSTEERTQREQRLANLAASRAALAADESDEYVRTASGRIVRRMNDRFIPEEEFEMYENSEIDDSSFSESDDDDGGPQDNSPRVVPPPSRQSVRIRSRGSRVSAPPHTHIQNPLESPVRTIRVKRKSLKCDHCGTEREIDKTTYDEYTSTGKRVRCRWIGFSCEFPPASDNDPISDPSPQRRSSRLRELRR